MQLLIFIVYLSLFAWIITRIPFFKNAGLGNWWLISLFFLKVFAGIMYGLFYMQPQYIAGSDTWRFFNLSIGETDWLVKDPWAFIKDLFIYGYDRPGNLFLGENSYWNDLKSNLVVKLMAIFNVFTFKNYYANIILFNFLFFFGPVALYRLLTEKIQGRKVVLIGGFFCIPSFLFWCSGAHKDGLIFTCIGIIIYHFHTVVNRQKFLAGSIFLITICFVFLFALRNFIAILLIPALATWYLCDRYPARKFIVATSIYVLCILFFFLAPYLHPSLDFPQYVVNKQNEFKQLGGNSQIEVPEIQPSVKGFVLFLPNAVDIGFFRPHISEIRNKSYIPAVAEIIFLWVIIVIILTYRFFLFRNPGKNRGGYDGLIVFCIAFSASVLLLSGYTITVSGSIVRYRSIVLPFLFTFFIYLLKYKPRLI